MAGPDGEGVPEEVARDEPIRVPDPIENVVAALEEELGAEPVELVEWISFRIKAVSKHSPEAKALLMKHWPEGVPTKKNELVDPDHHQLVLTLLDNVEAEMGMTFPAGDPRQSATHTKKEN